VLAVLYFIFLPCFFIIVLIISKYSRLQSFHKMEATTQLGVYIHEFLYSLKLIMAFAQEE
jgi:ABC-type bacteriocin/lantibiotic exporter with double-glycine peptidase domain